MLLHPSQVNLNEENIEQYLFENPGVVSTRRYPIARWLKRQYHVPSGIIDLLGVTTSGDIAVVELKSVEIKGDAILQVMRYTYDIDSIIQFGGAYKHYCYPILIGPSINDQVFRDCEACSVRVLTYRLSFSLAISETKWNNEWREKREDQYTALSKSGEMAECIEKFVQMEGEDYYEGLGALTRTHTLENSGMEAVPEVER